MVWAPLGLSGLRLGISEPAFGPLWWYLHRGFAQPFPMDRIVVGRTFFFHEKYFLGLCLELSLLLFLGLSHLSRPPRGPLTFDVEEIDPRLLEHILLVPLLELLRETSSRFHRSS